jgi:predicted RNA-binding Zn ribbon-like protein
MGPKDFQLFADHPALDFVNTLDYRGTPEKRTELLGSYEDLLAFSEQAGILTNIEAKLLRKSADSAHHQKVLRDAITLRETFGRVCYSIAQRKTPLAADIEGLNAVIKRASGHRVIHTTKGQLDWTWDEPENPLTPVWRLAISSSELLTSPEASRIRICESEPCQWLFLDKSKNHSRRWCNMNTCGNREKARRFYQSKRTS